MADAATPAPDSESATYYPWFDWLRIVLASTVVLFHAHVLQWKWSGNFAVQVFFALSGWLIGGILLETRRASLPHFYFLRATRNWIPYGVALALLISVSLLRDHVTPKYLEIVFYKLTFVYNLFGTPQLASSMSQLPLQGAGNHFWSICAEEQFYLFAPLLLVWLPARYGRSLVVWALVTLLVGRLYPTISLGVCAALVRHRFGAMHRKPWALVCTVLVVTACSAALATGVLGYQLAAPPLALAIVLLFAVEGPKQTVAGYLGGLSYPLYLNHWFGLFVGHSITKHAGFEHSAAGFCLGIGLAFAFSAALHRLVDRNVLSRRHAWYTPGLGRAVTIAAYSTIALGCLCAALI